MTTKLTSSNVGTVKDFTVSWQSVITADGSTTTNVEAGKGYFIDTTSAAHTVTLPASATIGDIIHIKDYAGTFGTNNLTILRNGHNIQGITNDSLISTNRASISLFYIDSTKGWLYRDESNVGDLQTAVFITATGGTETTDGDFKVHTFTGDGTFTVCSLGNPVGGTTVDYLVIAGGGGGSNGGGGGGGAGGYRESFPNPATGGFPVSVTSYPITVGGGGTGLAYGTTPSAPGNGSNSIFSTITSTGGGTGGSGPGAGGGQPGGSGGGGGINSPTAGGTGNTPPVSPPQGNPGGTGGLATTYVGGGGGGAGSAGTNHTTNQAGPGGNGATSSINGTPTTRAGGGGGASENSTAGTGGPGGGGDGTAVQPSAGTNGTVNTGGGGGGGGFNAPTGSTGGKGIVIIRYKYQ